MLELPEAPRTRSARSTSTGTAAASRSACAARRSRCSRRILCLAQSVEVFARTVGLPRRATGWRSSAAAAGSTRRSSTRCSASATTAPSGPARGPARVPPVARWEPADRVLIADDDRLDRVADAFARVIDAKSPFTARHSAEVAALGGRHRRGDGLGGGAARPPARRAAARHRQARRLQPDPRQARHARRRRVGRDARAPALHAADPRARRVPARHRRDRGVAPRAARRHGLPPRAGRVRPVAPRAHPRGRRRLRGADRRPAVPQGDAAREALAIRRVRGQRGERDCARPRRSTLRGRRLPADVSSSPGRGRTLTRPSTCE